MDINSEMEREELRSRERIDLGWLNLQKAKLELETKTNVEKVNMGLKVKEIKLGKERIEAAKADIPKLKTNIRLRKLEFKKFNEVVGILGFFWGNHS